MGDRLIDVDGLIACQGFILDRLTTAAMKRTGRSVDEWVAGERLAVALAANEWGQAHGIDRRVTVYDVERVEQRAIGHIDYAPKLALYVAELVYEVVLP